MSEARNTWQQRRLDGYRLAEVVGLDAINARLLEGWLVVVAPMWRAETFEGYETRDGLGGQELHGAWVCLMWAPE